MQRGERYAAKLRGDRVYNTGKPCSNGHNSDRYTQSGACCECLRWHSEPIKSDRFAAIENGELTYTTGKPCRNGHDAPRYTRNGNCTECVKPTTPRVGLPSIKVRAYHSDRQVLAAAAWMYAMVRIPTITQDQIDTGVAPTNVAAGTGMYSFKCHMDDQEALRELAAQLVASRHIDTEKARRDAIEAAASAVGGVDTTPPINFT